MTSQYDIFYIKPLPILYVSAGARGRRAGRPGKPAWLVT
jgi:hypothetical protein